MNFKGRHCSPNLTDKTIRRGDIYWAEPPAIGKHRFLVVQNNTFNSYFDETIVVPIISKKNHETTEWKVELPEGRFPKPSVINCSAIITIKSSELGDFVSNLDERTMQGVDYALSVTLGLESWLD